MTLPLAECEMPFHTSVVPFGVQRGRAPLYPQQPAEGRFLVWRVLGFGGHSNPLTYSRVACFAARSGQALLVRPSSRSSVAEGRLQLYVDDPILTVKGSQVEQQAAVDILILWLALGIPLSWANEAFCNGHHPHVWIGVTFLSTEPGTATMSIPEAFS